VNKFEITLKLEFLQHNSADEELVRQMAVQMLRNNGQMLSDHGAIAHVHLVKREVD
jgi:hypothetical protein